MQSNESDNFKLGDIYFDYMINDLHSQVYFRVKVSK